VLAYTDDADGLARRVHDGDGRSAPVSTVVRRATLEDVFLTLTGRRLIE
jgi:lipooligosaccharide transport system ATP-binding protein